jgi:CheY-like chemotaxis protein
MKVEPWEILKANILIVDDQKSNVDLLEQLLQEAGYINVASTTNSLEVGALHRKGSYDLILLDLQMPGMDGFQLMEALKTNTTESYLPVIAITAQPGHKVRALQCGAKDFVSKPFDVIEVRTRIYNMLEVRLLYNKIKNYNELLEQTVRERTAELRESEERYRCLTELACDWYWEQDETGNFTKFLGPILEMLGGAVSDLAAKEGGARESWDESARVELKSRIAARQPFLDFVLTRVKSDGTQQRYQISGQPVFDCSCAYIGYRGVGVELTAVPPSRRNVLSA